MKKVFSLALFVLLAGSALLQSCSKPDAVTNTPDPTNPTLPVDSTEPEVPSVPLTEAQTIQKAIEKLGTDTFDFTGFVRIVEVGRREVSGNTVDSFVNDFIDYSRYPFLRPGYSFSNRAIGIDKIMVFAIYSGLDSVKSKADNFYNKVFINADGDSFIGSTGFSSRSISSNSIVASDFSNMERYKTIPLTPFGTDIFPNTIPKVEVQYYFNKDSLVLYQLNWENRQSGDTSYRSNWIGVSYGKKRK